MRGLSDEQRWAIVFAWKETNNIRATASRCGVKETTAARWVRRYKATGDVRANKSTGRKRALDDTGDAKALTLLLSEECGHAAAAAQELVSQGITANKVAKTTLVRAAKRAAFAEGKPIRVHRGKPVKRLTVATKAKRLAFAKANLRRGWNSVMFTDRKKFNFSFPGAKVKPYQWVREGEKPEAAGVNHPQVVNIYAGITRHGVTSCHVVAGTSKHKTPFKNKKGVAARNITAEEHLAVVETTFLPEGRRIFSHQGISSWVLQQDNDPAHKAAQATISKWNSQHKSSISLLLNWPPNSPDLNPIENIWAWMDAKLDALGCKTFEEYQQAVANTLKAVPSSMIANLFNSMPKRMEEVIRLGGDKTRY